MRRGEIWNLIT